MHVISRMVMVSVAVISVVPAIVCFVVVKLEVDKNPISYYWRNEPSIVDIHYVGSARRLEKIYVGTPIKAGSDAVDGDRLFITYSKFDSGLPMIMNTWNPSTEYAVMVETSQQKEGLMIARKLKAELPGNRVVVSVSMALSW